MEPVTLATAQLVCFPHAESWSDALPPEVELLGPQAPGPAVAARLRPPFVLFGHGRGALAAFELARWLHRAGRPQPAHLYVAGIAAPHITTQPDYAFHADDHPLACPITALRGRLDHATPPEELAAWCAHTSGPFVWDVLPGGRLLDGARHHLIARILDGLGLAHRERTLDPV